MESSFLTTIMLPALLAIIMFGMGLSLTLRDFVRLWQIPRPVLVGLFGQLLVLPLLAYALALGFALSPPLAIGLMILAACPGGTMSNVISHLARANLALSVSLTAITTVVCVFTTPLIIQFALTQFASPGVGEGSAAGFSLAGTAVGLFFITLMPVITGIAVRRYFESWAKRTEVFFRRFSALFMVLMIAAILIQERDILADSFADMFAATTVLNLLAITIGMLMAAMFRLSMRDSITLGIEIGIQNASMAILIAVTFLQTPAYATAAGVYGITMYIGAIGLVLMAKRLPD